MTDPLTTSSICAYCQAPWTDCKCGRRASEIHTSNGGTEARALLDEALAAIDNGELRSFTTGATRDTQEGKLDPEGFLSPLVLMEFSKYMHHHRVQSDGSLRASDNWQKGMPLDVYMKSLLRHVFDLWMLHRGLDVVRPEDDHEVDIYDALGGIFFNVQGYWLETLKRLRGKAATSFVGDLP